MARLRVELQKFFVQKAREGPKDVRDRDSLSWVRWRREVVELVKKLFGASRHRTEGLLLSDDVHRAIS